MKVSGYSISADKFFRYFVRMRVCVFFFFFLKKLFKKIILNRLGVISYLSVFIFFFEKH